MSLNPRVRQTAFAAAFLGAALLPFATAAQQVAERGYQGSPACAKYVKDGPSYAQCEINQSNVRIQDSNRRAGEAAKSSTQDRGIKACVDFLTRGVTEGTLVKTEILERGGGSLNDGNACVLANHYGYGRGAAAATPAVN